MNFRITGLDQTLFAHLNGLSETELARHNAVRYVADADVGFPDRIGLSDARRGESVILVNFTHQPAPTPYRASHAIFVREAPGPSFDEVNVLPPVFRGRVISLRAFDTRGMLVDAGLSPGETAEDEIRRLLELEQTDYLQAHFAKQGCYAARIERA
jgi:Protein of unknown function (DUF1203)